MNASLSLNDSAVSSQRHGGRLQPSVLSDLAVANRHRDAFYLLSEQLHRANSVDEIHSAAMDAIESALDCDRSAILLFDSAGFMQFAASRGLSDAYRSAVAGHSPWKIDEADPEPIAIADIVTSDLDE